MPNSILATGLSGLVGSRFVELNPDLEFADLSIEKGFDLTKVDTLNSAFENTIPNIVLNFAAFTDTAAAWDQKGDKLGLCYQINVVGVQNLVALCQKYNKHLIHISTDYVFDGQKSTPYTESDAPNPLDWYGETKFLAEKVILDSKIPATIVRISSPYRAQFDSKVDLVRKIISKLEKHEVCQLFTDQFTTPTFIDDIAIGLRQIIDAPQSGIFHLVGSSSQSVYHLGLIIAQVFGFEPNLIQPSSLSEYLKSPNSRPYAPNLSLSNEKFVTSFSLQPDTTTEGLQEVRDQLLSPPSRPL